MASEKITAIIDEIKGLSILELKELIDTYCEEFGVSAAAQVAVVAGAADAAQQSGGAGISHLRQASHGGRGRGNDADRPQSARRPVRICPAGNAAAGGNCGKSRPQALRH